MTGKVQHSSPIVLAQPLEERVDKAAERQLSGRGPLSREQGRQGEEEDEKGWWYHDGEGGWDFYGEKEPS